MADRGSRPPCECSHKVVRLASQIGSHSFIPRLVVIQDEAGSDYPTVRNRARVAEGESHLNEVAQERDRDIRMRSVAKARELFEKILEDYKADAETLAGVFTGLGDCLYLEALAKGKDPALLKQSLMNFLRVVVLYKDQTRYLPKAEFFAGRCLELLGAATGDADFKARAERLYRTVIREFPGSQWASEAKAALR